MFGIGGSKQSSTSQSTSLDYGANVSRSFSDSLAESLAQSQGSSFGRQNVWNADILQKLYAGALDATGQSNVSLFQGQAADLFNRGAGFLDTLGVGAGEDYLQSRLTDTSARDEQLAALRSGLGDLFRTELNPAITSRGVATGTLGGGRQGVAQGQAVKAIAGQYAQGAADIIGRDQAARDQAAGTLGTLATNRANVGANALPALLGIAQAGFGAPMSPYSALASIVGGPAILSESGSQDTSFATSESVARALSEAFGFNYGTSQSTSKSKGKSFSFGAGE